MSGTGTKTGISQIGVVAVHVTNQDATADWFVSKLGFVKTMDVPMGPDSRWVQVSPPGAQTQLSLMDVKTFPPHVPSLAGKMVNPCIFEVENFEASCRELKARGVNFTIAPEKQPWGWWAEIEDPDGNSFGLHGQA
ncbi:MAG TPA: VOC family protein [Oscillatoriaceae cyanobacterium]